MTNPFSRATDDRRTADENEGTPARRAPLTLVPDERDWVDRIRAGDVHAFEALFDAYYEPLCDFVAGYLKSDSVAEELVQDVLFHVWAHRADWRVRDSVRQYLYGAARNRALDMVKRSHVVERWAAQAVHDPAVRGMGSEPRSADERAHAVELARAVHDAVDRLPARRREACVLRYRNGLSIAEIAAVMGISGKGVEAAIARALDELRATLSPLF